MNNPRRNQIAAIASELDDIRTRLADVASEEREAADSMAEHFPESEQTATAELAADTLEDASSELEAQVSALETIT